MEGEFCAKIDEFFWIPRKKSRKSGFCVPQNGVIGENLFSKKFGQQAFVPQYGVLPQIGVPFDFDWQYNFLQQLKAYNTMWFVK